METRFGERKKGVKAKMLDLNPNETILFPRSKYSTVRTTMSTTKVEHPDRSFGYDIVDEGILVTCLK